MTTGRINQVTIVYVRGLFLVCFGVVVVQQQEKAITTFPFVSSLLLAKDQTKKTKGLKGVNFCFLRYNERKSNFRVWLLFFLCLCVCVLS
jgi:hypothetical protein